MVGITLFILAIIYTQQKLSACWLMFQYQCKIAVLL